MGALSAAALLAQKGLKPLIIEQNWIPGGCSTSYPRKGFIFESGATTLTGLDAHMPLRHVLDQTGICLDVRELELPMQVHLCDGRLISRHRAIDLWIEEAAAQFEGNQRGFWEDAWKTSQFVWEASSRYLHFPPGNFSDLIKLAQAAAPAHLLQIPAAFKTVSTMMQKYRVDTPAFRQFVDEQLLITAQNHSPEVNWLFGAAALCYTNYGNYYLDGGLSNLVQPFVDFVISNGGALRLREKVTSIHREGKRYVISTDKGSFTTRNVIAGIPLNNLNTMLPTDLKTKTAKKILPSKKLYSAFQMGIAFRADREFASLHHQIHLSQPLAHTGSRSIFVSLSHPKDHTRSPHTDIQVASISSHIPDPENCWIESGVLSDIIINTLDASGFINKESIVYQHSSGPKSWQKWTGRAHGFVGGYPQLKAIKPWQMVEARMDGHALYICGDTAYPGQGIPGATLSGIIAATKLIHDRGL